MKKVTLFALVLFLITLMSCKKDRIGLEQNPNSQSSFEKGDSSSKDVKNLVDYKNTIFLPTLEHKITNEKNAVYCATLLFAWDEIKKQIPTPLTITDTCHELKTLNQSTSFIDVLNRNEYEISSTVNGENITAKAKFTKSLPLKVKLQSFTGKLKFDKQNVASFGIQGNDSQEQLENVKIIYYKNDHNFIIKLIPKENKHEIILFMTDKPFYSIDAMISTIETLSKVGKKEMKNDETKWKYMLNKKDEVIIPKFYFNIETNFKELEGNSFFAGNQYFQIETAWQRTAFALDEKGAEVESEACISLLSLEAIEIPKRMVFDKPFLILLKRIESKNPYFALWTTNTELMIKE